MGVGRSPRGYKKKLHELDSAWVRFSYGLFAQEFRAGIIPDAHLFVLAREGWCDEVWDFSGHLRISSGNQG
jgi:hypothetical protein